MSAPAPNGIAGATIALVAIFLPSFLLIFGALPFWDWLRGSVGFRRALAGINAAVVGILLAALYTPIWTGAVTAADRRRGRRDRAGAAADRAGAADRGRRPQRAAGQAIAMA